MTGYVGSDRPAGHLTTEEAAERLGIHPRHLLRLIRQKKLRLTPFERPTWRARRRFWFSENQVQRCAADRQTLKS